jgi:hypothetical protein
MERAMSDQELKTMKREAKNKVVWAYGQNLLPNSQKLARLKVIEAATTSTELNFINSLY